MVLLRSTLLAATILFCIPSPPSAAQVADSLARPSFIGFEESARGVLLTDSLPARLPFLDLADLAARSSASFAYLFGAPGWPDALSFRGLSPRSATAVYNELPFTYLFTGAPAFDLIPVAFVEAPRLEANRNGYPLAVTASLRPFASPRPLTEGRYWKGGEGLQSIDVVHAQNRRRTVFRRPGLLNLMAAYSGRAATGEYPGSALRRGRQLHFRGRYEQQNWSLKVLNVHNRRRIGAHAGVIPAGDFETIYIRTGARVENPLAERRLIRNDLSGTFRFRAVGDVTALTAFWTSESFRYRDEVDTLNTESDRLGVRIVQPVLGLSANVEAWLDRFSSPRGRETHGVIHGFISDSLTFIGWSGAVTAGAHLYNGSIQPGASLAVSRLFGRVSAAARVGLTGERQAAIDESGFGTLRGLSSPASSRVLLTEASIGYAGGTIDGRIGGFFSHTGDPLDYFVVTTDSAAVLTASSPFMRAGVYADLGWRRAAERGFYLSLKPTLVQFLNGNDSPLHRRSADALPRISGRARVGMRYLLFQGDLDLDAYVEAVAWSTFRSRTLHAQSGLLVIPEEGSRVFGPSSMIDIVVEAGIREAKVFAMYRNALSGTNLMPGNLIVPNYPLPAREFRIGVYWPIFD